ncbi:hypothetical protein KL945_003747 [Ogataea haglerorum]|nr:hypothetical protein KL945_003747 [Ogataea haglerorum]
MLALFVPSQANDPAVADHVIYDDYVRLQQLVTDIRSSWAAYCGVVFGDRAVHVEGLLPIVDEAAPAAPKVYRSGEPIEALFQEWTIFLDSAVKNRTIGSLMEAAEATMLKSALEVQNLHRNSTQFFLRLRQNFSEFADLNDVLAGFVYALRLGLDLLGEGKLCDSKLWPVDPSVLGNADKLAQTLTQTNQLVKSRSIDAADAEKLIVFEVKALHFQRQHAANSDELLHAALMTAYYRWSMRRLKLEEQESKQHGVFQYDDAIVRGAFRCFLQLPFGQPAWTAAAGAGRRVCGGMCRATGCPRELCHQQSFPARQLRPADGPCNGHVCHERKPHARLLPRLQPSRNSPLRPARARPARSRERAASTVARARNVAAAVAHLRGVSCVPRRHAAVPAAREN